MRSTEEEVSVDKEIHRPSSGAGDRRRRRKDSLSWGDGRGRLKGS